MSTSRADGGGRQSQAPVAAVTLPLFGLAALVGIWWAATAVAGVPDWLLPSPSQVVASLADDTGYMLRQTGVTLAEALAGFGLAAVFGVVAGTVIATWRTAGQALTAPLVAFNSAPKVAFAPLLVVWLGYGMQPKIAMTALVCFFPILLSTATGLLSTPSELDELARSLCAGRWATFLRFRLPSALPHIFAGLKQAMPLATIGAIVGELAGGGDGLGFVISSASGGADIATAIAAIVLISAGSTVLFFAVVLAERLAVPWVRDTTVAR